MKAKTINKALRAKINDWLSSIEDESVRKLAKENTIVTGGAIASMLLREPVNDYDIYFRNYDTALAVAKYYVQKFTVKNKAGIDCPIRVDTETTDRIKIVIKSSGVASDEGAEVPYDYFEGREDEASEEYVGEIMSDLGEVVDAESDIAQEVLDATSDGEKYRPIFMSTNAITLSNRVQLVLRFFGEPDVIHENYDFVHCTNYWTSKDSELVLRQPALEALLARELRYVGSKYPVCSVIRIRKFVARGWTINAGQILKMMMQINQLDLTNPLVLEDQLTGVDAAYFVQLIQRMKSHDPDKIDTAYLCEIVDRIF